MFDLVLAVHPQRLELIEPRGQTSAWFVDFVQGTTAWRRRSGPSRKQPLARAVGVRGFEMSVLDTTAGLGRDAFLLACLGCRVTAVERSSVLFALLQDGWRRAVAAPDAILKTVMERLHFVHGDARDYMLNQPPNDRPQVAYVDPMYPPRKTSALAGWEVRLCRALVGADDDSEDLFRVARRTALRRVVVKRHRQAPPLKKPDFQIAGRSVRYDVYLATCGHTTP